ncbi:MAG: tyrosine-protein kinase domain-containing protein [Gaiellaceae bacterium]
MAAGEERDRVGPRCGGSRRAGKPRLSKQWETRVAEMSTERAPTIRDYLNLFRRRKWLIIQAVVLIPVVAVFLALRQQSLYEASSNVLLGQESQFAQLTGIPSVSGSEDPVRFAQTQAQLAQIPAVAALVLKAAHVSGNPYTFFQRAQITADPNTDLMTFSVTDHDPALAIRLVNAYAEEFTRYRRQLDTGAINQARRALQHRLRQLEVAGQGNSTLYADLSDRDQQLATMAAIQSANTAVVRQADAAAKIQPRPRKYAILGLMLGLAFGIGLALLWEALDTRIRSGDEIADKLRVPLLGRLPTPSRKLRSSDTLAMVADPSGGQGEAFRILRTNLDFVLLERKVKVLMITSAIEQEGKSTTIANLAIALARGGQRVTLVDLDLRRPYLDRFFRLEGRPGLTHVALGQVGMDEALVSIPLGLVPSDNESNGRGPRTNDSYGNSNAAHTAGFLHVLTAGAIPPDTGEFVGKQVVADILRDLSGRADIVLVDAPPLLRVGDALTLSAKVDALIIAARVNVLRRGMLNELMRMLEHLPAPVLGMVLTGADVEGGQYHRYSGYYRYYGRSHQEQKRVEESLT